MEQELYPWRCTKCQRINKKIAEKCAICSAHWSTGLRHSTEPKAHQASMYRDAWPPQEQHYAWEDWDAEDRSWNWQATQRRVQSRSHSSRSMRGSQSPRGRKGKGAGKHANKGKRKDAAYNTGGDDGIGGTSYSNSPFAPLATSMPPWPTTEGAPQALMPSVAMASNPSTAEQLAQKKECVAALRIAYPDVNAAPAETKDLIEKMDRDIEKLESDSNKFVTKNIHSATTALGKAQKTLTETLEAKKAHRNRWIKHITEAVTTWQSQLQEFQKQQAKFQDVAAKARSDIESARSAIQTLSSKASQATLAAMPPLTAVTAEQEEGNPEADSEELKLQGQLQTVLQNCAAALKMEIPDQDQEVEDLTMEDEERDKKRPRSRSMQPFGGPGGIGEAADLSKS